MKENMKKYEQIEVVDQSVDSFGTLSVRVFNNINKRHYTILLDEGEHYLLQSELETLDKMSVWESYEPTEGNGVFK